MIAQGGIQINSIVLSPLQSSSLKLLIGLNYGFQKHNWDVSWGDLDAGLKVYILPNVVELNFDNGSPF